MIQVIINFFNFCATHIFQIVPKQLDPLWNITRLDFKLRCPCIDLHCFFIDDDAASDTRHAACIRQPAWAMASHNWKNNFVVLPAFLCQHNLECVGARSSCAAPT